MFDTSPNYDSSLPYAQRRSYISRNFPKGRGYSFPIIFPGFELEYISTVVSFREISQTIEVKSELHPYSDKCPARSTHQVHFNHVSQSESFPCGRGYIEKKNSSDNFAYGRGYIGITCSLPFFPPGYRLKYFNHFVMPRKFRGGRGNIGITSSFRYFSPGSNSSTFQPFRNSEKLPGR